MLFLLVKLKVPRLHGDGTIDAWYVFLDPICQSLCRSDWGKHTWTMISHSIETSNVESAQNVVWRRDFLIFLCRDRISQLYQSLKWVVYQVSIWDKDWERQLRRGWSYAILTHIRRRQSTKEHCKRSVPDCFFPPTLIYLWRSSWKPIHIWIFYKLIPEWYRCCFLPYRSFSWVPVYPTLQLLDFLKSILKHRCSRGF